MYEGQDNYEQVVAAYQQAVAIHRDELGEQSREVSDLLYIFNRLDEAAILQKIANLYEDQNRYEEALDYLQ